MRTLWTTLALAAVGSAALATEYCVAPDGQDGNAGTQAAPFRTLARAGLALQPGDTLTVRGGVYRETLSLARSGSAGQPITVRAAAGEQVTVTGADALTDWRQEANGTWSAPFDAPQADQIQLFDGAQPLREVTWPKGGADPLHPAWAKMTAGGATTITDPSLTGDADHWRGALLFMPSGYAWICQSRTVTAYDPATHTLTFDPPLPDAFYTPKKDNEYRLIGAPGEALASGEWRYDAAAKRVALRLADGAKPSDRAIEAKRRVWAVDLAGRQHVRLLGLGFRAAGLRTDGASANLVLDGLRGEWLGHNLRNDAEGAVVIAGQGHSVRNCSFRWSSSSVMRASGRGHRIENNLIECGNYGGKWQGVVALSGRDIVFAWNTVRDAGRDVLSIHHLTESRIVHNDLSHAGWLTADLGMTYGHNTDFGGTEIAWNRVHENEAAHTQMGIYFDHCSHNVIVHHNAIWGVRGDAIRFNNPGSYLLAYHNSCWHTGAISTFDHSHRNDLLGTRYQNNIVNAPIKLPEHCIVAPNLVSAEPPYADATKGLFTLTGAPAEPKPVMLAGVTTGGQPYFGAYQPGAEPWRAGHDFAHPPAPEAAWQPATMVGANRLRNANFELGTIEGWTKLGDGEATCVKGNGWGNKVYGDGRDEPLGTSLQELRLSGAASVEETVTGLTPGQAYRLTGWLKVSEGAKATLSVAGQSVEVSQAAWTRQTIEFTAPADGQVVVSIRKSAGEGYAWADVLGLT